MKISIKFLTIYLGSCLFMAVPFAKALPSPACVQQCTTFCAAIVANFSSTGTGPLSQNVLFELKSSAPQYSIMADDANDVAATLETIYASTPTLLTLVTSCQSSPSPFCSIECSPPPRKSMAEKPTVPLKKAAPSQ